MKKIIAVLAVSFVVTATSHAEIKIIRSGGEAGIDTTGFPSKMKSAYKVMAARCAKCHSIDRALVALLTGTSPVSHTPFTKDSVKRHSDRLAKHRDSGMTAEDIKVTDELMIYLINEASR